MGLLFHTNEGMLRAVPTGDFFIFGNNKLVVIFESVLFDQFNAWQKLAGGLSVSQDIIGSSIVTDKGKYIGTVREVLIVESPLRAVYRVVESTWQKIFGGGFFIAAELPYAFSREGARFLVRTDQLMRNQASNPIEAIRLDDTQSVPSGGWQAARN
jgi:hypothetical protein